MFLVSLVTPGEGLRGLERGDLEAALPGGDREEDLATPSLSARGPGRDCTGARASTRYWITWSARCNSDGGIVRPSALAVLSRGEDWRKAPEAPLGCIRPFPLRAPFGS